MNFGGLTTFNATLATLSGSNSYSGGIVIPSGRVSGTNGTPFGTGPITVLSGGQAYLNSSSGTDTFANNFLIAGNGASSSNGFHAGAIRITGGTLAGTITLEGEAGILAKNTTAITGQITGTGNLTIGNNTAGSTSNQLQWPSRHDDPDKFQQQLERRSDYCRNLL